MRRKYGWGNGGTFWLRLHLKENESTRVDFPLYVPAPMRDVIEFPDGIEVGKNMRRRYGF